jgi:hypothetical protein
VNLGYIHSETPVLVTGENMRSISFRNHEATRRNDVAGLPQECNRFNTVVNLFRFPWLPKTPGTLANMCSATSFTSGLAELAQSNRNCTKIGLSLRTTKKQH